MQKVELIEKLIEYATQHDNRITVIQGMKYTGENKRAVAGALDNLVTGGFANRGRGHYTLDLTSAEKTRKGRKTSKALVRLEPPPTPTAYETGPALVEGRIPIVKLYEMVEETLSLANRSYLSSHETRRLNDLVDAIEYEIDTSYPSLKSIFVPQKDEKGKILPPERWNEPFVKHYLTNFVDVMTRRSPLRGDISENYVYSRIKNPAVRGKLENRTMTEAEYTKLRKMIMDEHENEDPKIALISGSTALEVRGSQGITLRTEEERLDGIESDALLAVESGFTQLTVKKHRKHGVKGSDIVEEKQMIDDVKTSATLLHRLRECKWIDRGDHKEFIELSRHTGISGVDLIRYMEVLSIDFRDLSRVVADVEPAVLYYSEKNDAWERDVWKKAMDIYSQRGDYESVIDELTCTERFERTDDIARRDIRNAEGFSELVKSANGRGPIRKADL